MKCLTNKWREGAMLLSFLLISSLAGIFTACDDIEDEYITDTQLSILQESRTSLNYLLKNSTYGTAPGTYPETGKDILNAAITELDALITRAAPPGGCTGTIARAIAPVPACRFLPAAGAGSPCPPAWPHTPASSTVLAARS